MSGKTFLDTNILIYLFSKTEPNKRKAIVELLEKLDSVVWSTQVIQEFYQVMTSKYDQNPQQVKNTIRQLDHFELAVNDKETILEAIEIQSHYKLSFWDSLVVSAAKKTNCKYLLAEDLTHNQEILGIKIINPFKP